MNLLPITDYKERTKHHGKKNKNKQKQGFGHSHKKSGYETLLHNEKRKQKKMKTFTLKEIQENEWSKRDLAENMGLKESNSFDYALPQNWLDSFVGETGLDYNLVRSTTFMVYSKNLFGEIVSGCFEVQEQINKIK